MKAKKERKMKARRMKMKMGKKKRKVKKLGRMRLLQARIETRNIDSSGNLSRCCCNFWLPFPLFRVLYHRLCFILRFSTFRGLLHLQ